jgi:hypothetical protein
MVYLLRFACNNSFKQNSQIWKKQEMEQKGESIGSIVAKLTNQKIFVYLLLLSAGYIFFHALSGLYYGVENASFYGSVELALSILEDLAGLGIAAVVAMLGLNLMKKAEK